MTSPYDPTRPQPPAQTPAPRRRVQIDAGRLWAGGAATAVVAALIAVVGEAIANNVLDVRLVRPAVLLPVSDNRMLNYAVTAFLLALAATGLAHLLSLAAPRPQVFFAWIVGLCTVAAVALPFAFDASLAAKLGTAIINLIIGLAIGTLLTATLARTVVDPERSWQGGNRY
jgi:Family of unknown function (DUF6069)